LSSGRRVAGDTTETGLLPPPTLSISLRTHFAELKRPAAVTSSGEASMIWLYELLFPVLWVGFLLYWQVKAAGTKATERLEPAASRIVRSVVFLCAIVLMSWPHIPVPWLYRPLLPQTIWTFWSGAAITTAGLLFAVWARQHLGTNWSRSVTIKQDHQLIVTGPYALVRHPIYTGILTGFLGTDLAIAQMRGIVAFVLIALVLWYKLRMEEQWMRTQFGAPYEAYSRRTAALVPFVL
jgi:protein-S-isoprenylcysteine O-methyltransferase Ste14